MKIKIFSIVSVLVLAFSLFCFSASAAVGVYDPDAPDYTLFQITDWQDCFVPAQNYFYNDEVDASLFSHQFNSSNPSYVQFRMLPQSRSDTGFYKHLKITYNIVDTDASNNYIYYDALCTYSLKFNLLMVTRTNSVRFAVGISNGDILEVPSYAITSFAATYNDTSCAEIAVNYVIPRSYVESLDSANIYVEKLYILLDLNSNFHDTSIYQFVISPLSFVLIYDTPAGEISDHDLDGLFSAFGSIPTLFNSLGGAFSWISGAVTGVINSIPYLSTLLSLSLSLGLAALILGIVANVRKRGE